MDKYDNIIIGFGKGGKTLAGSLAKNGQTVALIEKSEMMYGGTCINVGCIPSKSLILSAQVAKAHNFSFDKKSKKYEEYIQRKRELTTNLRGKNFKKLDDLENVTIYNANASFKSNTEVEIEFDGKTEIIKADKIFINTGSFSRIPNTQGIENNPFIYDSESLMELDKLPEELVIVGGGNIGLEFASMFSNFGSNVTLIQHSNNFLKKDDEDIANEVKKVLENQGINFIFNAETESFETKDGYTDVNLQIKDEGKKTIKANAVLIAIGRSPNTQGLKCENAGVDLTSRGAVVVDENLKTTASNIWAMGDVTGALQFTYTSLDDYRIVLSQVIGDKSYNMTKRQNIPFSTFFTPPLSKVGLTEKEAREKGLNIKVAKLPTAAVPKAQVLREPTGFYKAIVDADTNKILGASIFAAESHEVINIIKLAMDQNLDYTVLKNQVFTHPTMAEALNDLFSMI